jgi:ligand-binding SRPBCC domain-containing protein
MKTYEKVSLIRCDLQELYRFHLDLNNLITITPKNMTVTLISAPVTPQEGDILELKSKKGLITTEWKVLYQKIEKPYLLVDVALKSPFAFWEHSHIFTPKEDGMCELKDIVRFKLPFGAFGACFNRWVIRELEAMFTYRHQQTYKALNQS